MNKIDKEKFLNDLQMVKSGLSSKELLEQSNCFVFKDGYVFTFNDEVACRKKCEMSIEGAVPADLLLATLEKIKDPMLEVDINSDGQIEFRGKNKKFAINRDAEVLLPIEKVTEETPQTWKQLPGNFSEVINKVKDCVSTDEANNFSLTCVHLHPDYIEACDNKQLLRWHVSLGNSRPLLVRGSAISSVVGLGMTKVSSTLSWIHFKNAAGLIFSCRKFAGDEYPPGMDEALKVQGEQIKLPKGVVEASDRASIYASEITPGIEPTVGVHLAPGMIKIEGSGLAGWYQELKKCVYNGPKIHFVITPTLLQHICNNFHEAKITAKKLKATGGSKDNAGAWEYVTSLGTPKKHPVPTAATKADAEDASE